MFGAWLSGEFIGLLGVNALLLAAATILALSLLLFNAIDRGAGVDRGVARQATTGISIGGAMPSRCCSRAVTSSSWHS